MLHREELIGLLKENVLLVEFNKANGEKRTMRGTLLTKYLPQSAIQTLDPKKVPNLNIVSCWDLEKNGWPACRLDSIEEVKVEGVKEETQE